MSVKQSERTRQHSDHVEHPARGARGLGPASWLVCGALTVTSMGCPPPTVSSDAATTSEGGFGSPCRSDRECSAAGLVCDRAVGSCAQCASAADCPASQRCQRGACAAIVSCTSSRMCPGQVCDTTRGFCVDCVNDVDCTTSEICQDTRCLPRPPSCTSNTECSASGRVCDVTRGFCVECLDDSQCASGTFCGADQRCQRQVCMPNSRTCGDATRRRECNAQGTSFVDITCADGELCAGGMCVRSDAGVGPDGATPPDVVSIDAAVTDIVSPPVDVVNPPVDVVMPTDSPVATTCPSPGDPRVPNGRPFQTFVLRASDFLPAGATAVSWTIGAGNACDQLTLATQRLPTFTINGSPTVTSAGDMIQFRPSLSGTYRVTVSAQIAGAAQHCSFDVRAVAPGFRVELCRTPAEDIDLWLHDPRNTNPWLPITEGDGGMTTGTQSDTCRYTNCRNPTMLNWGYTMTTGVFCNTPSTAGFCLSPRLEVDAISETDPYEAIAVDTPRVGDTFRVGVNFYGTGATTPVFPMVLVHCGGMLRATLGGAATPSGPVGGPAVMGFVPSTRTGDIGTFWRVADVTVTAGDNCTVTPLVPSSGPGAYCVDTSGDRSFNGPCRRGP